MKVSRLRIDVEMKKFLCLLVFIILWAAVFDAFIMLFDGLVEACLVPSGYLFYEFSPNCSFLMAPLLVIPAFLISYYIFYKIKRKITSEEDDFLLYISISRKLGKWKIAFAAAWVIALYMCLTSLTCVTDNQIIVKTPLNPFGREYRYSDVQKVKTGFGSKTFTLRDYERKGSFYYTVILDNREAVFHTPTPNPDIERYKDTYLELEEFDNALSELNIPKESSSDGHEDCKFDQIYVERFLRITESGQ